MFEEVVGRARGGIARAERLSPEERTDIARRAAAVRWSPESAEVAKATHEGIIHIGDADISCAVLDDGRRVLSQSSMMRALGRARQAKGRGYYDADVNMPAFLTAKNLKSFVSKDLEVISSQVKYRQVKGGAIAYGYPAEILPKVCDVFLDAEEAGQLAPNQKHIAAKAKMLMRGLAHVGIAALVDEATGYQEVRERNALQAILDAYLRKELAAWAKRFPDEFYKQMFRLRGWQWKPNSVSRPAIIGKYTNDLVYERLAPGILDELQRRNPKDEHGRRKGHHHRWLTDDVGHPALAQHLHAIIGFMRASTSWDQFYRLVQRAFPKKGSTIELPLDD